jgi:aspartyl-tRNA(Asn)/glutamyl-tRNA(Gln) amidotransferase subunit B
MNYVPAIGLEVHVQLKTRSKMFCACPTGAGGAPNTQVCPVCLGYPGAMPTMNGAAVRLTVLSGLMLGSKINRYSKFDRKSYFYPDMPKNYQISQYDKPLCLGGQVTIEVGGQERSIALTRIHLEEDVGKSIHFPTASGVDFNRAGHPLMEIVTEPDIASPEEAQRFLAALRQILRYVGVSDCNLEAGNMRCDVNCSVRPEGQAALGTKTELKNLNTLKGVFNALTYEVRRQIETLESGGRIIQETRRWDPDMGRTFSMRTKEDAHDYRYFPEPDLMPVVIDPATVEAWRAELPELPRDKRQRFVADYGLPEYDAGVLAADRDIADFFEATVRAGAPAKAASNWIMTEVMRVLAERETDIGALPLTPAALAGLLGLLEANAVNAPTAKEVFAELVARGGDAAAIVKAKGLTQLSDSGSIEALVRQAMEAHPKSVDDFRAGKVAAAKHLVGQVMRLSRGKANPRLVNEILERLLG